MTLRSRLTTAVALIICTVLPAWGEQFLLYTPQPATPSQKSSSPDGILVQEIEIQKGDTLYDLSRKFNGRGRYFSQILLFNSIKNPNLIYAGKMLRIPLSQKARPYSDQAKGQTPDLHSKDSSSIPGTTFELPLNDLKTEGSGKSRDSRLKKKSDVRTSKGQTQLSPAVTNAVTPLPPGQRITATPPDADTAAGQKLFEAAVKSYRQDDCRTAIELLDRYLADNSSSPLAADANLYKAECYLKLSAQ